ncbi:MAG: SgcJ/EcaC family oxidoreductase, partial [Planctomycetota bacterium]
ALWTEDAISIQEETGSRTEGREALLVEFQRFFGDYPQAQLMGQVDEVRFVGPDVAIVEGAATIKTGDEAPIRSLYTAVLHKQGDRWLIANSHERDMPRAPTAYDALQPLEWLVGTWQDETDEASVMTTVRWAPSRNFLIRSFEVSFKDGEGFSGTQLFGWDPLSQQIRTWVFNSDGSFGDGTVSKSDNDWLIKMNQIQSDGRLASGTNVLTRVDEDTLQIQKIGQSVDGEPVPASDPVNVTRVPDASAAAQGASR